VARTRMGQRHRCIGALGPKNEPLRLMTPDGGYPSVEAGFQVGEIWEVQLGQVPGPKRRPHTENVAVLRAHRIGVEANLSQALRGRVVPWRGSIQQLFDGLVRYTYNGNGYICERVGIPGYSTGFWIPDRDLVLRDDGRHFDYITRFHRRGLAYVGEQPPPARIPAGTLVRVSLATWWRPEGVEDVEERCYLQLSHWYE